MWEELEKLRNEFLELGLSQAINYEKLSMMSVVNHSAKIEGCSLTENDTRLLPENDITDKGKPLTEHMMVKEHFSFYNRKKRSFSSNCYRNRAACC